MTRAKTTLDQYNAIKAEWREKLQPLFEEKNKQRNAIKTLLEGANPDQKKVIKSVYKSRSMGFNIQRKHDHKDLIAKYQEFSEQKKLDEATFQKGLEEFRKLDPELDEQDLRALIMWKADTKESKEVAKKSLEFEENTFKIDSTNWIGATKKNSKDHPEIEKFIDKWVKVKVNATGDVVEYLEWSAKWEQLFITYDAFIREVMKSKNCTQEEVEAKYLMTVDEFKQKMEDKPDNSEEYNKFFEQEVKWHLAGYWDPSTKGFYNIGARSSLWLAGGDNADFIENEWGRNDNSRGYGFSGRLLKN